jgi:hypothetical protein
MSKKYKFSYYPSNKILDWSLGDNKKLFEKKCKKYPNNKSLKYYKENPIEYSFNNYGFRTPDDFNSIDEGNVFLGDSHTMGNALHIENVWSYKLNKKLGGKFWNLSQGGSSIQTDYRLLLGWKDDLKIKNIVHFTLPHPRFEFFYDGGILDLKLWGDSSIWRVDTGYREKISNYQLKFFEDVLIEEEYCNYNQIVYINAIKGVAKDMGCNYYYMTDEIFKDFNEVDDDSFQARDLIHYSIDKQDFIYSKFYEIIE